MRRFRNPSYAPEFLERKLSPSGISGIPVPAEVSSPTATASDTSSTDPSDSTDPNDSDVGVTTPASGTGTSTLPSTGPDGVPPVVTTGDPDNPTGPN